MSYFCDGETKFVTKACNSTNATELILLHLSAPHMTVDTM
jgi:hypothetical protein